MRDIVKRKLEKIDELYPPQRIQKSKKRLDDIWHGIVPKDRLCFTCYPPVFNPYNQLHTAEERLQASLDEIIIRGYADDDFLPSIFCGCRQSTIPNMFGAKEIIKGSDATCDKILLQNEDIDNLTGAKMGNGTVAKMWLDMQAYIIEQTDGKMPVHVVDMQGPFDVAGQLFGYDNLFLCALEDEKRFDTLMMLICEGFVDFWKAQQKICGSMFVPTHLFAWSYAPKNYCAMSIDSLVMASPDFYNNFYKKYIDYISSKFDGLSVHSCGNFKHLMPDLMKTKGITAINSSQMSLKQLVECGLQANKVCILMEDANNLVEFSSVAKKIHPIVDISVYNIYQNIFGKQDICLQNFDNLKQENLRKHIDIIKQELSF